MPLLEALSTIREAVVSKVFDCLLDKLSEFLQFPTEKEVREEIEKLEKELKEIRAVLDDAEERQMKDQFVKIWLTNLQNLAYDVEDIVDELATEIGKRDLMERRGSSSKKRRLIPPSYIEDFMFNKDMMSKIKDITAKLKDLEPQKNQLQLKMMNCEKPKRLEERQQPTSVEIESHVYGRDKDKQRILDLLLKSNDEGNFVIPIVGLGGIGKTTLAQLVYNDATIQNHFELKAWVCVSDDFDVKRITKDILQSVTSKPCNDADLNKLQEMLKEELSEKKFLIVLDDVWNENYHSWTIFQSPFLTRIPGSKIIVTTRSFRVSLTMGATHAHSLEVLSDDDCLSVFAKHALGERDFGGHPSLKEVAEKIVRQCSGLPLAAKTLGGLLRTNIDPGAWEEILKSEIWKLSENQCGIIPALQLSYHHLPPYLKRCFAYCSILPKDYEFKEEEIILLWRAEGLLQAARDKQEARQRQDIEDLGREYFRDLVSRSLLQKSMKDNSRFVMHDLINDLAQSVAGEICITIDSNRKISKHTRHLSYIAHVCDGIKKFEGIPQAQHLRTFLPFRLPNDNPSDSRVTSYVLMDLLPNLRRLRVLSLKGYRNSRSLDFVGDLKHLRYLDLSYSLIFNLPESVSDLYNLETLLLEKCGFLEKLPSKMENLVNLCHLDITGVCRLGSMPSNFGILTNLQTLTKIVLGDGKGSQITELKDLKHLKGRLCISGLENVVEPQNAWIANLRNKSGLEKLELQWSYRPRTGSENEPQKVEKEVLERLEPSKKLKELTINSYRGAMLANWVGDSSFKDLHSLCLEYCPSILSLPSIGKLPSLKKLFIRGLHSVTSVGVEFFGENTPDAFKSLEILEFKEMSGWENWNLYDVNGEARKFPKLRELLIGQCPSLLGSIPECLPCLEKLNFFGCDKLIISIQSFPKLSELEIQGCQQVVYKGFADDSSLKKVSFSGIPNFCCAQCPMLRSIKVESLEIDNCDELFSFRENNWGLLTQRMSIGNLKIQKCPQLVSTGAEDEREELMHLKITGSIEEMTFHDCERLEKLSATLQSLASLRVLVFYNCPKLISLSKNSLPSNLQKLKISLCVNLQYLLFDEGENVSTSDACVLRQLEILSCPSLKRIFRGELPTTLKKIEILFCEELESIAQEIQDNSSLEEITIGSCKRIQYLPQGLNKLRHLCEIIISHCSNLISFPK